jgi:ABC-type uncharacterized transport system permease subunit
MPVIGSIYSNLLSGHFLLTYLAFALVPFTWWVLYRTRFGLRLRAVGENPVRSIPPVSRSPGCATAQ